MSLPFRLPGFRLDEVHATATSITISAHAAATTAVCPRCGQPSRRVHSYYTRSPRDLPVSEWAVRLELGVRRFRCVNAACSQQTFAERLPEVLPVHAQRTQRLSDHLGAIAHALGGAAGARLGQTLHMAASADTGLRLLRRSTPPALPTPRVLGVDDWAWRKGRVYGTLLVDLEQHRVVDLLADRSADTLATWLRTHPGVAIISRDRSTEYARGASDGAPQAVQVIDRWHLLQNLREALERLLERAQARLRALPIAAEGSGVTLSVPRRSPAQEAAVQARRQRRAGVYEQAKALQAAGWPIRHIARQLGIGHNTARRFVNAEVFPERAPSRPQPSRLAPFVPYLTARWQAGCENASQLWREIRDQGFGGTRKPVSQWVRSHRTRPPRRGPQPPHPLLSSEAGALLPPAMPPPAPTPLPGARRLAWLLFKADGSLTDTERTLRQHIRQDAQVELAYGLVQQFLRLVRQRQPAAFEPWVAACLTSGIPALQTFATSLQREQEAVLAALNLPWSNGQVEGQVNRLKLIKRQGYGRAGLDLLRRRLLPAA